MGLSTRWFALVALVGAALVVAGAAVIYWPLALILAGVMALALGLLGETRG